MYQPSTNQLIIGYYPIRAKAQVIRLLCELLKLPYRDQFYSPVTQKQFFQGPAKKWLFKELPYLIDSDFIITDVFAICQYLTEKVGRTDLFGKTFDDQLIVDKIRGRHDLKQNLQALFLRIDRQDICPQQKTKNKEHYWNTVFSVQLTEYNQICKENDWFFGYLSILDIIFYQLMGVFEMLFPEETKQFKNLNHVRMKFGKIPQIERYEATAGKQLNPCPKDYFSKFRMKIVKQYSKSKMQCE